MAHVKTRKATGTWVVRAGGAVLAETGRAIELTEGEHPDVIYFPREDVAMAFLDPSPQTTECPHKGQAVYFHIVTKSQTLKNAAWSYEEPNAQVSEITGHLAFHASDTVTVEQVQAGARYGSAIGGL